MSKNVAMFIDVANMYYAARGQDVDIDYVALLKHATKGRDLIRAYAYTGLDPENESQRKFIDFLAKNGYKPVIKDIRKFGDGRMKANLDIELVVDLFRLADRMDIAVIASGDGDFAPAIKALQDKGVRCEVISFKPNTSSDLIAVADEFQDIMKIASISRKKGEGSREASTSMPTPEMPAKEVNPEFGFREASPGVAAAALAAIRGGGTASSTGNGRRTRGGSTRRTGSPSVAAAAAEPVAADEAPARSATPAEALAEGDELARRRRRRRGGRGRGRTRRDEDDGAEATPTAAGTGEIGWEEFDDLSHLDGTDDAREYTFEEADAATLAELGLTPAEAEAAPAEEEKPKRRSTRTRKAAAADVDAEATEAAPAEEERPKRRATRTRKAAAESAPAPDAAEEKPKRRTTRTGKAAADAAASAPAEETPRARRSPRARASEEQTPASADSGEPQGIWGRFRSARKPRGAAE